jgi:hypothetical protein
MGFLDVLGAAGSILTGGATGLLGVVFQRVFDAWNKKQELDKLRAQWDHDLKMKEADAAIMREEWAQRTKIAEVEGATAASVAADGAFAKSFETEPKSYSAGMLAPGGLAHAAGWLLMVTLDAVRGIVRPGLTLYLCWIATKMYEEQRAVLAVLDASADAAVMSGVYAHIVNTLLYLFTTCVLWWFGTRSKQAAPSR